MAATPGAELAALPAARYPVAGPATEDEAGDGAVAGPAMPPEPAMLPEFAALLELALPEQPATAAMRISVGMTAPPSRRHEERGKRKERGEREERAVMACLLRMPLGRERRNGRLRRQVTFRPQTRTPSLFR